MTENDPAATESGENSDEKRAEPRSPRSIRFFDSEWARMEQEAKKRGMTPAELVRHATVSFATGKLTANAPALPTEVAAQVERIYHGVYLLSTLKRDELTREGCQQELDKISEDAHESQASIRQRDLQAGLMTES